MSLDSQRFQLNEPNIAADIIDGEAVIMNLVKGHYYSAVDSGADIWKLLAAGWTIAEIAAALTGRYGIASAAASDDVRKFAALLLDENLLLPSKPDITPSGTMEWTASAYQPPALSTFSEIKDLLALDPPLPDFVESK